MRPVKRNTFPDKIVKTKRRKKMPGYRKISSELKAKAALEGLKD
jgi:hypothetical protein